MEELKRLRNELGWSQQRLADESGVNKATINQVEQGKRSPSIATLESLARALDSEVGDFFPKAQPPLPLEERGGLSDYLGLVNFQLERFLRGEDPKLVVGGLAFAASRLVEWAELDFEGEARRLSEMSMRVLAEADPNSLYWPLERKRLEEELKGIENLEEAPEESRKA